MHDCSIRAYALYLAAEGEGSKLGYIAKISLLLPTQMMWCHFSRSGASICNGQRLNGWHEMLTGRRCTKGTPFYASQQLSVLIAVLKYKLWYCYALSMDKWLTLILLLIGLNVAFIGAIFPMICYITYIILQIHASNIIKLLLDIHFCAKCTWDICTSTQNTNTN